MPAMNALGFCDLFTILCMYFKSILGTKYIYTLELYGSGRSAIWMIICYMYI